jgi:hypothetical protein
MDDSRRLSDKLGETVEERVAASFLLRLWLEPREGENVAPPLRGYVRHLQTGEELYFTDPGKLVEYVLRQLGVEHTPAEPQEE